MNIWVRTQAVLLALCLTASACADLTQPDGGDQATKAPETDLASAAVAALVPVRRGPYQIFIPDASRTETSAVVELMHGGTTSRHRFIRSQDEWKLAGHLGGSSAHLPFGGGQDPLMNRGTIYTSALLNTPFFAVLEHRKPDGSSPRVDSIQPVQYTSNVPLRWRQSGQVVTGWEDAFDRFTRVYFKGGSPLRWVVPDTVFTVHGHSKWTYGDLNGQQGTCTLAAYSDFCYPAVPRTSYAWVDGYYSITVQRRTPSSVRIEGTSPRVLSPGDTRQLSAVVSDADGTLNRAVTWSSSNPAVASVSSTGLLTVNAFGNAVISATSEGVSGTLDIVSTYAVNVSGPTSAVEEWANLSASAKPAGSYHYEWSHEWCEPQPDASLFCSPPEPLPSGQDVTTNSVYVSRYDSELRVYVNLRHSAGGPILASGRWLVRGRGDPLPGEDCGLRRC